MLSKELRDVIGMIKTNAMKASGRPFSYTVNKQQVDAYSSKVYEDLKSEKDSLHIKEFIAVVTDSQKNSEIRSIFLD